MSGRLKKPSPSRIARSSGLAVSRRENTRILPKRSRPRRTAASNTVLLCVWYTVQPGRTTEKRAATAATSSATKCGTSHISAPAWRSPKSAGPSMWISRFSRLADACHSNPRSSRLRPRHWKCSRASARRSDSLRSGKHSSRLRNAMRRRWRATAHSTSPSPRPSGASSTSGNQCNSHSRPSTQRVSPCTRACFKTTPRRAPRAMASPCQLTTSGCRAAACSAGSPRGTVAGTAGSAVPWPG